MKKRAYAWRVRRSETEYPTREELFSIAPATVLSKAGTCSIGLKAAGLSMQMKLFRGAIQ